MTTADMQVTDAEATVMEGTSHARIHSEKAFEELKARVDKLTAIAEERRSDIEDYACSNPLSAIGLALLAGATLGAILVTAVSSVCKE